MTQFVGANVDELEQLAQRLKSASQLAEGLGNSLKRMVDELRFFGRYGEEFAALINGVTAPSIRRIVQALAGVGSELHSAAQRQRQVSDGKGKTTPTGADKPAATGAPKQPAATPPATIGGRIPGTDGGDGRYVDY